MNTTTFLAEKFYEIGIVKLVYEYIKTVLVVVLPGMSSFYGLIVWDCTLFKMNELHIHEFKQKFSQLNYQIEVFHTGSGMYYRKITWGINGQMLGKDLMVKDLKTIFNDDLYFLEFN